RSSARRGQFENPNNKRKQHWQAMQPHGGLQLWLRPGGELRILAEPDTHAIAYSPAMATANTPFIHASPSLCFLLADMDSASQRRLHSRRGRLWRRLL